MIEDAELLRRYASDRAEDAFAALVDRHLPFVFAAALRQVGGDSALAQDVAMGVFADLANKAAELARHRVLVGWLFTSTRYAAAKVVRGERRRRAREQEAHLMHEINDGSAAPADWAQLRPVIDEALEALPQRDREAVLLRFFEGRAFPEIGARFAVTGDAARLRVERALEKIRHGLARHGVTSTPAALALALANQPAVALPAGLASTVTSAALASATTGGVGGLLALFTMSKIKVGIVSVIVAAVAVTGVVELRAGRELRVQIGGLRSSDGEIARLQRENLQLSAAVTKLGVANPEIAELTRLRTRLSALKARPDGVVDAEILPPQNRGRATARAAMETFCWAIGQQDLEVVGSFINFSDDTPENREAFMANFSPAVRARYGTPERLCAAAFFSVGHPNSDPQVAMQIVSIDEDHGPNQVKIKIWGRNASGAEWAGGDTYVKKGDGWTAKPVSLTKDSIIKFAVSRLDPATGEVLPAK